MPYPIAVVNNFTTSGNMTTLAATPEDAIENRPFNRRFYNFNMVITKQFPFNDQTELQLTDNTGADNYLLIDRLGNPVLAEQLAGYAANRRCIASQFDSVTKTIRILSCICPTDKYINAWLNPPTPSTDTEDDSAKEKTVMK